MRLDKYLSDMNVGTRSSVKELIKKGHIKVNGVVIKKSDYKVNLNDEITVNDKVINYVEYEYIILNKPAGYLSATEDKKQETIMDIIKCKRKDLVPVGRLDKDTEGLILITNDGKLNHDLLSPENHVDKKYYVEVDNKIRDDAQEIFSNPIDLGDFVTKPSKLEKLDDTKAYLTISEGKNHQVKNMMKALGYEVRKLHRCSFSFINVEGMKPGEYRKLKPFEVKKLKLAAQEGE